MTGISLSPRQAKLPGRHVDTSDPAGWLTRRVNPAAFMQVMLIVCIALIIWPTTLGGRFGMVIVAGNSMEPTYNLGDAVITWRQPVSVGDAILYRVPEGESGEGNPVIHRVVGGDTSAWVTQGDAVSEPDLWYPTEDEVLGVAQLHIPLGGRVVNFMRSWWFVAALGGLAALLIMWPDENAEERRRGRHENGRWRLKLTF